MLPMWTRVWTFLRENPLPGLALLGLVAGVVMRFGLGNPVAADWIWLVVLVIGGAPLVWHTVRGMLRGNFAADVVAMLAIITAVITREYFAGLIIVLMQSGGEALEHYSLRRASSALELLLARAPRIAHRQEGDRLVDIDVAQVAVGDLLVVRPGDLVPVDGTLLSDQADIDESALTGEPLTRAKNSGEWLLSGSVNTGDAVEMQAGARSADSQYTRIVELVRKAQEEKPPLQRLADRYAVWFTPLTLLMCVFGWLITREPSTILAVLVVATPCPLILAVPVAVISGINRAADYGIIIKGGAAIEHVGRAQAVVFDKTGTLTHGTPVVSDVVTFDGLTPDDLLRQAGSVEQLSSHLLARTIAEAAQARTGALPLPTNFRERPGYGVAADLDGRQILVGSPRFLTEELGSPPPATPGAGMASYVAIDGRPTGAILFSDRLRPGVATLMDRLRALGVRRTVMLTGDRQANATRIGQEAGVDEIVANLLPADKVRELQTLKSRYDQVVMVGDGINDAPALATASVGIAMGAHGTGISAEAADIVLLVDDVTRVGDAVAIGQRMRQIAQQSIFVGLGLSLAFMVIASFGLIPPAIGALLQEVIDVAVILNALRAREGERQYGTSGQVPQVAQSIVQQGGPS
ncbi:MAG: heavy metal translocating P-type ATPase [Thermomicrobiales bacterium]